MKTAVILAARKERDSETPYPLVPVSGDKCLIDRTLTILKDCGYDDILIVVGYRRELFDKYRGNGVRIIVNDDYEFTASMSSLACCREYISGDFLLVEGDTFFEKDIVERLSARESGNCFSMTEESHSGDECYVDTRQGYIWQITKDRHRVHNYEGELMGISRISQDTYNRMLQQWDRSTNSYINYEYLAMDVTDILERPVLYFRNTVWGDVDCKSDFERFVNTTYRNLKRKENPFDEENLRQHLKTIFDGKDISAAEIIQIGGMSNKNFRVNFENRSYVLRVPGNGSEGMVDRSDEEFNAAEGCRIGVNPPVRYFNPATGIKLADFIDDAETLNAATIQRHGNMQKVAGIYRRIHNHHVRLRNEFNVFKEIAKYDNLIDRGGV